MIEKNSPSVWDNVWKDNLSLKEEVLLLEKEKKSVRWKRVRKEVLRKFGSFKKLKAIELGAGRGTFSALFSMEGAEVTLLDYSPEAISSAKLLFKRMGLKGKFILGDLLKIDKGLINKYDISMSMGVAEHFKGQARYQALKSHFEVLNRHGMTIIDVPNKLNAPYRLQKFLSQSFGRWKFGEEYPYSIFEFNKYGQGLKKKFHFVGGCIYEDPFLIVDRIRRLARVKKSEKTHHQIGTPLDKYFSRNLIAIANNY